jgi:hypothetical protein
MDNYYEILDCYETSQVQIKISSLIFSSQKQLVIKSLARAQTRIRQARLANPPFRYQNSGLQKKHFCIKQQSKNKRPVKFYATGTLFCPYSCASEINSLSEEIHELEQLPGRTRY